MENKKFMTNSLMYLISSIITQIINLILIPIYTRNMTSAEFGQYNLVSSLQGFLSIFITLAVFSGLCRFFNEVQDKNKLKNTALNFSIIWGIICCFLFAFLLKGIIADVAFKGDKLGPYYVEYIIINSSILCLISIYTNYYSMLYKAKKVCIINISQILLTLCFTYYYLALVKYGILGVYRAQLFSFIIVFLTIFALDIKNYKFVLCISDLKKMLSYGLGLVPGQISSWILTLIDRYFIKGMINLTAVAVYSMGYKIGMLIQPVFLTPFASSFTPFKFSTYKEHNGKYRIKKMFKFFNFTGWFIILGLSVYADTAIRLLSTKEYSEAYKLVAVIAFSYYLWGLSEFYLLGLLIENKMLTNSLIVSISAAFNILFNFLLIPHFGIYGAAMATCGAYLISNILYYLIGRKYYNLGINLLEPYKYGCIFLLMYFIYIIFKFNINNLVIEFLLNIILCISYIVLCIKFKLISYDLIVKIKRRFYFKVYIYRADILEEYTHLSHGLSFGTLNLEKLNEMMKNYADEIDENKYRILKDRLSNNNESVFIVYKDKEIMGYFSMAYGDVTESATNAVIRVPQDSIYLFDDYTFKKHRGKGVHQYSILRRLQTGNNMGRKYAYVGIYPHNIVSQKSYMKFSFKRVKIYSCIQLGKIKKTYERVISE